MGTFGGPLFCLPHPPSNLPKLMDNLVHIFNSVRPPFLELSVLFKLNELPSLVLLHRITQGFFCHAFLYDITSFPGSHIICVHSVRPSLAGAHPPDVSEERVQGGMHAFEVLTFLQMSFFYLQK